MQEILSVTELTTEIKKQIESRFPTVAVKGEISNLKEQASGHIYFTLKDAGAQLSAVFFRGNARELSRQPKNGDQVVLRGEISLYTPRGQYQIVVRKLEYAGVGELLLKLHEMKAKLQALGWFDSKRKRPLPKFPKTIGIVTSPTGAVIQDIQQVLARRNGGVHVILHPVKVQGEGAAEEIARAIGEFNQYELADLLIVGRGGGSLEDLWAFNEECVAKAIFLSKIPVISAVGHETDFSIADLVADVRAPTPSAAAEIATTETAQQVKFLQSAKAQLRAKMATLLEHNRKQLHSIQKNPLFCSVEALLGPHFQRVDDFREDIALAIKNGLQQFRLSLLALEKQKEALNPIAQIAHHREKLGSIARAIDVTFEQQRRARRIRFDPAIWRKNIDQKMENALQQCNQKLLQLSAHLKGIDPKNLLTKGYCILFHEKRDSVILSTQELNVQDRVHLMLHDGRLDLTVNEKYHD